MILRHFADLASAKLPRRHPLVLITYEVNLLDPSDLGPFLKQLISIIESHLFNPRQLGSFQHAIYCMITEIDRNYWAYNMGPFEAEELLGWVLMCPTHKIDPRKFETLMTISSVHQTKRLDAVNEIIRGVGLGNPQGIRSPAKTWLEEYRLGWVAHTLEQEGRLAEAEATLREAQAAVGSLFGTCSSISYRVAGNLCRFYMRHGRDVEATELWRTRSQQLRSGVCHA